MDPRLGTTGLVANLLKAQSDQNYCTVTVGNETVEILGRNLVRV